VSPRIRSAYDLYISKKFKSKKKTRILQKLDTQIKDLMEQHEYVSYQINTLDGVDFVNKKLELEQKLGNTEEMLEAVILTALEMV
jgi:archaellum component FlaC